MASSNKKGAFGGGQNLLGGSGRRNNVYSDDINWYQALNAGGVRRPRTGPTKAELKKDRIKAEVKFEIDRTPVENMNYANVPPELLDSVKAFITNQGREHGRKGMIQKQMHESDLNRINMKVEKDIIADSIPQLNSQFLKLKQMRQEWAENNETDAVSDMVDPDAIEKINNAVNNKLPMTFSPQGNIVFGEGEDAFELASMPKYFNKDFKSSMNILNKSEKVFRDGVILNETQQLMYENDFNEILSQGGDETLLSLAFDKGLLGGPKYSYLNIDNYQDQLDAINGNDVTAAYEARAQIREDLTSKYMTALNAQAQKGWELKQVNPPGSSGTSTSVGETSVGETATAWYDKYKSHEIGEYNSMVKRSQAKEGSFYKESSGGQGYVFKDGSYSKVDDVEGDPSRGISSRINKIPTMNDWKVMLGKSGYGVIEEAGEKKSLKMDGEDLTVSEFLKLIKMDFESWKKLSETDQNKKMKKYNVIARTGSPNKTKIYKKVKGSAKWDTTYLDVDFNKPESVLELLRTLEN